MNARCKKTLALITMLALAGAGPAGCGDDGGSATPARPFNGAVSISNADGTQKETLVVADGYPQVSLGAVFEVIFVGTARGASYTLRATINPANVGQRYELPRDAQQLTVLVQRDGAPEPVGTTSGFMQIDEADSAESYGAGIVSLAVNGAGGFSLADIDVTFQKAPRP
ncbi:MAG: hypothetical protein KC503_08915 [Myxococcales bacterium]|nr:hypothetical protein [Myxococcales bacterium]